MASLPILRAGESMLSVSSAVVFFDSGSLSDESMQEEHFSGLKGRKNPQTLPDQSRMLIVTFIMHSV